MKETSKCHSRRLQEGHFDRYLIGTGIDIGCGDDPLRPPAGDLRTWDWADGDAQAMAGLPDQAFDFVYSSHCLEHLHDVDCGLRNWSRLLKPGGWLYVVVPDYCLYEHLAWPSYFNGDHKATFSLDIPREKVRRPNHWHIHNDLVPLVEALGMRVELVRLEDEGYDYSAGVTDQTLGDALAQICAIFQRGTSRAAAAGAPGSALAS